MLKHLIRYTHFTSAVYIYALKIYKSSHNLQPIVHRGDLQQETSTGWDTFHTDLMDCLFVQRSCSSQTLRNIQAAWRQRNHKLSIALHRITFHRRSRFTVLKVLWHSAKQFIVVLPSNPDFGSCSSVYFMTPKLLKLCQNIEARGNHFSTGRVKVQNQVLSCNMICWFSPIPLNCADC